MDNAGFSNCFRFLTITFAKRHVTDNRGGVDRHFIGYMRRGHVTLESQDRTITADAGEVFYIPNGCRYISRWEDPELIRFESFGFRLFPDGSNRRYLLQKLHPDAEGFRLLEALSADKETSCRSVGLLYAFLGRMLPQMESEPLDAKAAIVEKAVSYMAQNPEFSAQELARHCGTSQSGLYAAFQQSTGITPVEMKHRLQAEKAVTLLTATDLSVEEISSQLGFSSAAYFRRVLRQITGKTPREIRKTAVF
ncbi:MAG: helix-turn-helix transcriptional regulator [Oscillospiraceae bacterium]|nr:helix-turn-helix transcriptional regulator [Oscillospiraceae bacterium]